MLRADADGVLERADIYRTPYMPAKGQFGLDGQGRRIQLVKFVDPAVNRNSYGTFIADAAGSPGRFFRCTYEVVLPNNVFVVPQRMAVSGDRMAMSSLLNHEDVDLAYTTRYETLSMFTTDDISPCLMTDSTYADIPVPLGTVMTTENVTNAASIDISPYFSIEPITLTMTDADTEELGSLCDLAAELLGLSGIDSEEDEGARPLVRNSVVAQGSPIWLNAPGAVGVEVYDSSGALMQRARITAGRSLSTVDWSPGLFFIRASDARGNPVGFGRVVVE
jgi:hypothetical protein